MQHARPILSRRCTLNLAKKPGRTKCGTGVKKPCHWGSAQEIWLKTVGYFVLPLGALAHGARPEACVLEGQGVCW